jgi:hypothetical protein
MQITAIHRGYQVGSRYGGESAKIFLAKNFQRKQISEKIFSEEII